MDLKMLPAALGGLVMGLFFMIALAIEEAIQHAVGGVRHGRRAQLR